MAWGTVTLLLLPLATPDLSKEDLVELRVSWLPDMGPLLWHSREDSSTADQLSSGASGSQRRKAVFYGQQQVPVNCDTCCL